MIEVLPQRFSRPPARGPIALMIATREGDKGDVEALLELDQNVIGPISDPAVRGVRQALRQKEKLWSHRA
jgi:hypothetical protein